MDVLVYSLFEPSEKEGFGNVAINVAKRLPVSKVFHSLGRHRKLLFYSFLSPIAFGLAARRVRPKIVLVHTTEACFDPVIAKKLFRLDYKIVCVAHGLYPDLMNEYLHEVRLGNTSKRRQFIANMMISSFRSRFVSGADLVISVSGMVKNSIMKRYGVPSAVIPNGIDLKALGLRDKPWKEKAGNTLLFVGNQYWLKGLHYLIRANSKISKPWKIVAVGLDDAQEAKLKELVDCSNVNFKGKLSRKDLFAEYAKADAFAMPSVYESFGIVYLEALAFGLPVLASKGTGAEDIVKSGLNGFLVEKRDEKAISKALEKLRALCGKKMSVDKKFFWENISSEYMKAIRQAGLVQK